LAACLDAGAGGAHGFALAKAMADRGDTRNLTASGTLYRALHRLETAGLMESSWEDPADAESRGRPRRRMYCLTGAGSAALATAVTEADSGSVPAPHLRPGFSS
jgi:PadR family transcriptional regulator PadR